VLPALFDEPRERAAAVAGDLLNELLPGLAIEAAGSDLRMTLDGRQHGQKCRVPALGRRYQVLAYCPAPRQFAVVFSDITDRKQAEQSLRESERRQRAILNAITDPVWLKDKAGRCLAINPACCSLLGLSAEDAIGKTDFEYLPKDVAQRVWSHDRKVMESRRPLQIEEAFLER
jgi:PAS domain-containing protein